MAAVPCTLKGHSLGSRGETSSIGNALFSRLERHPKGPAPMPQHTGSSAWKGMSRHAGGGRTRTCTAVWASRAPSAGADVTEGWLSPDKSGQAPGTQFLNQSPFLYFKKVLGTSHSFLSKTSWIYSESISLSNVTTREYCDTTPRCQRSGNIFVLFEYNIFFFHSFKQLNQPEYKSSQFYLPIA